MDGFPLVARVSFFLHVSGSVIDDCEHLSLLSYSSITLDDAKSKNSSMITRFRPNRGLLNNSERILSFLLALFSYSLYPSILLYRMEILPKTPWLQAAAVSTRQTPFEPGPLPPAPPPGHQRRGPQGGALGLGGHYLGRPHGEEPPTPYASYYAGRPLARRGGSCLRPSSGPAYS